MLSPERAPAQVLAVTRSDTKEWALPGGFVKDEKDEKEREEAERAAMRDSILAKAIQTGVSDDTKAMLEELFMGGKDVHAGYVEDPRNTDNAWTESKVVHFHCSLARWKGRWPHSARGFVWLPGGSTCFSGGQGPVLTGLPCDSRTHRLPSCHQQAPRS